MSKKIALVVQEYWNGRTLKPIYAGTQRWCRDLASLCVQHGFDVTIYQKAAKQFRERLEPSVTLHGVPQKPTFMGNLTFGRWLASNLSAEVPAIFVSQEIAVSDLSSRRAVAVNHGIWWDGDFPWWKKHVIRKIHSRLVASLAATICVDTSYINWCHTEMRGRQSWQDRLCYIPNYADAKVFTAAANNRSENGHPTILFPRRFTGRTVAQDVRGVGLLLAAVEILLNRGWQPKLRFVGSGPHAEEVRNWAQRVGIGQRIEIADIGFDDMPAVVAAADVVVVPTLGHEGTALAAVEGIVSGKPTVVTHIGGLANIVIDGLNGFIADLSPDSLANAIERALTSPVHPEVVARACEALGKKRWEKQVWAVIDRHLGLTKENK